MSYYCYRRRDLQYTVKAMLCWRVQSHMWQTVAAFIGLMSLFGVPLSLVSHRQSKKKAVCKYIPHVSICTPNSRKHNEQRDGFSCYLFSLLHTWHEKKKPENKKLGWVFGYAQSPEFRVWYAVASFKFWFLSLVPALLGTSIPDLVLQYQKEK